jgi:hypothetical protein
MQIPQLWWLAIAIFLAIAVVVSILLGLVIAAAKSVDRHAGAVWVAGKQIAGNTAAMWMLDKTNANLEQIAVEARSIAQTADLLNRTLGAVIPGRS